MAVEWGTRRWLAESGLASVLFALAASLTMIGALRLLHQSPLMCLSTILFVNRNAPLNQGITGFLSTDPFFTRVLSMTILQPIMPPPVLPEIFFAGGGGGVVVLILG